MGEYRDPTTDLAADPDDSDQRDELIVAGGRGRRVRGWQIAIVAVAGALGLGWLVVPVIPMVLAPSQVNVCDSTFTKTSHLSPIGPAQRLGRLGQTHALGVPMTIWGSCASSGPRREVYVQLNSRTVVTYEDVLQG